MQLKNLGNSVNAVKDIERVTSIFNQMPKTMASWAEQKRQLIDVTTRYSTEVLKLAASQTTLTKEQATAIFAAKGLKDAELEEVISTSALSASQTAATTSTTSLTTAFKGLWLTLKANPLLLIVTGVTAAVTVFNLYNKSQEELAQVTSQAASEVKSASESINDYVEKYKILHDELTNANTTEERQAEIKKELLSIQTDLNDKYGDEYGRINLVTDAYRDQSDAIKNLNKQMAIQWLADNNEGIEQANKKMNKENSYILGSNVSSFTDAGKAITDIANKYSNQGIKAILDEASGTYTISIKANAEDAKKAIDDFKADVYGLKSEFKDDSLVNDVLNTSGDASQAVEKILNTYQVAYNQAKMFQIAADDSVGGLSEGYNNAVTAVQAYNDALASGDDKKIKAARSDLEDVKNSIDLTSDKWKNYSNIINSIFDQADTRLLDFKDNLNSQDGKQLLNNIKGYTETELRAMADDGDNGDVIDKLIAKAEEYKLSIDDIIAALKELGIITDENAGKLDKYPAAFSKSEMISSINGLSEGFEELDKIYKSISDKNPFDFKLLDDTKFKDTFSTLGKEYTDFIETIGDSPSDINKCKDAFNNLVTKWIDSTGILNHVDESNLKVTASMLKMMGVENADILVSQALAERKAAIAWENEKIHATTAEEIQALAEESGVTGQAKDAFYAYYVQKMIAENAIDPNGDIDALATIVEALGLATSAWKNYYAAKREMEEMSKSENQYTDAAGEKYYRYTDENGVNHIASQLAYDQKQKSLESKQKALKAEWEAKFNKTETSYGGGNKSNTSSGSGSKSSEKIYDWTEQALKRVSTENDKIREQVDDTNLSYDKRLSLQKQLLESNQDELEIMKTVNQRKVEGWEQAKNDILSTFGEEEGNDYISKILFGNIDKNEWYKKITDEAHKKLIDTAITANEELEESNEWLADKEKENAEDVQKAFEMQKNEIKALVDEVQTSIDSIQSSISIRETSGTEIITEADYRSLISHSKEQISLYEKQLDVLGEQLDTLDEGSAEWYTVKSQIASCEASINDCVEAQAEWNEEIKKLPIRRVERYLELLENIKTDITNFQAEQDVLGINATKEQYQELVSITEEQIKKLLEKHKELEKNLSTYTYGTDAFNECSNSIQDVENNISDLIQEMREYNNQILQIPINKIEELNEQLSNVNSALAEIGEDYSTTVNTVVDSIDHQIESIEDLKTAEEEAAQVKIDALQEQLDLLESQNEERKIQLALEQAEYNLERAKNQKTNQVVRNGEIVYEADQDDLRDAQQNLADAQYDKLTHDIETQIEQIEENRDAMIENYDAEIDRLEKISEKWSEIEHNIEDAKNAVIADDILGTGWKDKVLSGNDQDIYDKFVSEYETNLNQQDSYTKLIEQNEKISALMQQYIDAYNDGSITYEEAVKQFTAVQNAAKDGLTSEEYLNALLKISGDKDVDSALKNVQTEVSGAYSDFKSYFDAVNKNSEIIASYTSTWEEIRDAVVEQLETLKKLAEEEAKKVAEAKSSSSGRKHSSGGGSSTKWDSRDENNGPGREINDRAAGITSSSSSSSSSSSPSGPASDPDLKARKRKSGIETGIVGKDTSNSNAETVRILALDKLKSDEEPAILHKGEVVLNEVQMKNIVDNFRTALIHPINLPQVTIPNIARQQPNITIEMKDFNFNEVDNVRDFCDEMQRNFDPIMTQYFSKK